MTNNQINRAIAKAHLKERYPKGYWVRDYCNDLNAMHEAEKTLTDDQFKLYSHWVEKLMPNTEFRFLLCATASQRAEAFVRSLGKWATDKDSLTVQPTTEDSSVVGEEVQP